jgi:hypothetical protein
MMVVEDTDKYSILSLTLPRDLSWLKDNCKPDWTGWWGSDDLSNIRWLVANRGWSVSYRVNNDLLQRAGTLLVHAPEFRRLAAPDPVKALRKLQFADQRLREAIGKKNGTTKPSRRTRGKGYFPP